MTHPFLLLKLPGSCHNHSALHLPQHCLQGYRLCTASRRKTYPSLPEVQVPTLLCIASHHLYCSWAALPLQTYCKCQQARTEQETPPQRCRQPTPGHATVLSQMSQRFGYLSSTAYPEIAAQADCNRRVELLSITSVYIYIVSIKLGLTLESCTSKQ